MSYYLLSHPTARPDRQHRRPRRAAQSGTIGIHNSGTAIVTPRQLANSIANNSLPASYHEVVRGAEWLALLPDDVEAYQVATGINPWAWGLCFTGNHASFDLDSEETRLTLRTGAARIRAYWDRIGVDVERAARWLTSEQAFNRQPGLVHHGTVQPADRSDAWIGHRQRHDLDRYLVEQILAGSTPARPQEWDEMATEQEIRTAMAQEAQAAVDRGKLPEAVVHDLGGGRLGEAIWEVHPGGFRRHIGSPEEYVWLRNAGRLRDLRPVHGFELGQSTPFPAYQAPVIELPPVGDILREIGFPSPEAVAAAVWAEGVARLAA